MKRIFTFAIALMSFFAIASAANVTFTVTVPYDNTKPTTHMTYQVWIVGSFNNWNNNLNQLTKVDDTHYTITMDDATWAAGVTTANVQYKYCSGGGDWAYVEKWADGTEIHANRVYTGTNTWVDPDHKLPDENQVGTNGVDVVVRWATTFNPNVPPMPKNVTIDVLTPAGTIECYIVGTFNNWAGPTAPVDSVKMVKLATNPDGTIIFEKTIFTADANKLAYHFCSGPDWSFEQKTPSGDYKYPEVNPVVTEWKAIYDPTQVGNITITATVPAGTTDVWVNGSFVGWNFPSTGNNGTGGIKCTKNTDGTFSFTAPMVLNIEYKMYNGQSWSNEEANADGSNLASNRKASFPADANKAITVAAWKTPSAVKEIDAAKYKIYTQGHSIVVEGVTTQVDLFDVSGRNIQSEKAIGTFNSKNLNSGLYILKVDGATRKVAVK